MQPSAVLVDHCLLPAIMMPAVQKAPHGGRQMGIAALERVVELRKKKTVIADRSANAQQRIAQRRAMPLTVNVGMLSQQLAQQRRARPRKPRHADEVRMHSESLLDTKKEPHSRTRGSCFDR